VVTRREALLAVHGSKIREAAYVGRIFQLVAAIAQQAYYLRWAIGDMEALVIERCVSCLRRSNVSLTDLSRQQGTRTAVRAIEELNRLSRVGWRAADV
jgi:hypothetical protein